MKKYVTLIALAFLLIAVTTTCKKDVLVAGVKLNETTLTLEVDETATLIATVLPENAANPSVIFTSSNPIVATVTSDGLVTALSKGVTIIEATTVDGNFSAKCTVEVEGFVIEGTDVSNSSADIATVCAIAFGEPDVVLASIQYQNNSFNLKLPSTVDDKYLLPAFKLLVNANLLVHNHDYESWISDKDAKLTCVWINAWDENKNTIGSFIYHGDYMDASDAQGFFIYADRNFTIKGKGTDEAGTPFECDCSFEKGWNYVYDYRNRDYHTPNTVNYNLSTTTKPLGGFWGWDFYKW
jgi:hypothetical protein